VGLAPPVKTFAPKDLICLILVFHRVVESNNLSRTFGDSGSNEALDSSSLVGRNQWTQLSLNIGGIAKSDARDLLDELRLKLFKDLALDKDSRSSNASLTSGDERSESSSVDSDANIRIIEDKQRCFA